MLVRASSAKKSATFPQTNFSELSLPGGQTRSYLPTVFYTISEPPDTDIRQHPENVLKVLVKFISSEKIRKMI